MILRGLQRRTALKLVALTAVAASGTIGLAGCSGGSAGSSTTTITVGYQTESGSPQPFHDLVNAFEKAYPKIKVNVAYTPVATYNTVLATQLQAGNAPDVFYTNPGPSLLGAEIKAGQVASLDGFGITSSVVPKNAVSGYTQSSKLYAIPLDTVPIAVIVNTSAYQKLKLTPATTQSQVLQQCATVKSSGKALYQLAGSVAPNVGLFDMAVAASTVYGADPTWDTERAAGKVTFAGSTQWQQTLQYVQQMYKAGCFQSGAAAGGINNLFSSVAQGSALGLFCPASCYATVQGIDKNATVATAAFPGATADATHLFSSPSDALAMNAKSSADKQKAAATFLKYALSPGPSKKFATENGNISISQASSGDVPTYLSGLSTYLKNPDLNFPLAYLDWPHQSVEDALTSGTIGLFTGQTTVTKVLQNMDKAWDTGTSQ